MALSSTADQNQTVSRILNRLQYGLTRHAADITTATTSDILMMLDASDNYEAKYADSDNVREMIGLTATAAEINAAADVSARRVAIADGDYTFLAANSGKPHMVANVSADRTFTLPTPVDGLDFEVIATVTAADGHDWIIDTGDNANYLIGGALFYDTDASPTVFAVAQPNGSSNSRLQVNLPQGGTRLRFICDGTLWTLEGTVVSVTAPAFSDQA